MSSGGLRLLWSRRAGLAAALVAALVSGEASGSPLWLHDGHARVGLDASSDAGVFAWQNRRQRLDARLWWWVQVDGGPVRSLDRLRLELDRDGRDQVELESRRAFRAAVFELELGVWQAPGRDDEMGLHQEFEVENEAGRPVEVRLLLLGDFGGPAEHPIVLPSVASGPPGVVDLVGRLRLETSFERPPDRLRRGQPADLLQEFGVSGRTAPGGRGRADAWSAEWWLELQPFDEVAFAVQTRSVPEPASSLLLLAGISLLGRGRARVRCRAADTRAGQGSAAPRLSRASPRE